MSDLSALMEKLDEAAQAMVPADLKEKGWRYLDLPGRWTPDAWDLILCLMGEGEFQCLAMTEGHGKGGAYRRGQFFVSPQALENLGDKERYTALSNAKDSTQ